MRRVLFVFILLLTFSVSPCLSGGFSNAHAADTRILTLDQALSIAMEKNRDIEKAREYAKYVQGKYVEERSAALPQLSINGSAIMSQDDSQKPLTGMAPRQYSRAIDLTISQSLYSWGKVNAAIRAAEVGLKTAEEQLRLYRQSTYRDVSTAFYDILLAKEMYELATENLDQKKRLLNESQSKYIAGVATDYDVLAAEVAVENARPEEIRSANNICTARERLRSMLALDSQELDVNGRLVTEVDRSKVYEEALLIARSKRPELGDLRYRIGISQELVIIAGTENKPRLDLKAGTGWHWLDVKDTSINGTADGGAWNIGIHLSFPFFDGLKTSGKVTQARSDLRTREIEEAKMLDTIALEIRNACDAVKEAADIVASMSGTVRQAERLVQMAENGYKFGVKIRLEVDDAQLNLMQARSYLARAQRDYQVAMVNYEWAMGVAGE